MLEIKNVVKNYKGFSLDVSMNIPEGRIIGLIGSNGAGKSTLFKTVLGIVKPNSGEIKFNGKSIVDFTDKDKARIGVVFSRFYPEILSPKDIMAVNKATYSSFDEKFYVDKCNEMKIPLNKPIKSFSTGMKAKIRVISALSYDTDFLILDEPTAGLDVTARDDILDMVRDYMEKCENRSVIVSSHISSDIEKLCDEIYMIDNGKIVLHEDTDVLLSEYAIVKPDAETFAKIDKNYILKYIENKFSYECLTNEKRFFAENYPETVIENASVDEILRIMIRGEKQ